ncbi:predicted protein [Arabidopsis lyrata subsp. lyrata]|uniref:Predicted protein n=1 Tax=Arabidopsis lyrata subsp. lyrata TaxID=81972 RepID=D7M0J8_ARALL|nr:predicted protein [Arabidopsis lyrata subsp. lyrata]
MIICRKVVDSYQLQDFLIEDSHSILFSGSDSFLTSANPDLSVSLLGSISNPFLYASIASSNLDNPINAAPNRLYPIDQSGLSSIVFFASDKASS